MTCQDLGHALDPYLDDELSVLEVLRVQGHLLGCDRCRTLLESEAVLHALLAADALQDEASPTLRDRILQHVSAAPSGPSSAESRRRRSPSAYVLLAGGALVALLLVAFLVPTLWGPGDLPPFAVEVAAKHRAYTDTSGSALDMTTTDVRRLTEWLERRIGVPVKAPGLVEPGHRLVGGRVSSVADAPAAYLRYEWGGRPLSLFVMPPLPRARSGGTERTVDGVELYGATLSGVTLVWWEDAGRLYTAASTGRMTELEAFALRCVRSGPLTGPRGHDPEARHE